MIDCKLGGILNGDQTLTLRHKRCENIEESGLAGARSAGNKNIQSSHYADIQEVGDATVNGLRGDEVVDAELFRGKFPNGDARPLKGKRRPDDVDAGTVRQHCVDI